MAVRWDRARERSVRHWRRIYDGIGRRGAEAVVLDLNERSAICEKALEDAGDEARRCRHCMVFQDPGVCADTRLRITGALLSGDMDEARVATMAVIEQITEARPPEFG